MGGWRKNEGRWQGEGGRVSEGRCEVLDVSEGLKMRGVRGEGLGMRGVRGVSG